MSSDGSVSSGSRLRQFGLYRTIDARTEEFLRLSRKRQMRQGCACAAISTAVTVTVVICITLVYEYTVISEATRNMSNYNWLNLMNASADNLLLNLKTAKIRLDPSSIKLLPILLRTLKQKSFNETKKELRTVQSSSGIETFTQNLFPGLKKFRLPNSKFTVEYKTSPLIYFKNPSKSIEYSRQLRKIRDYERVMNYIDKMINDKVHLGTTIPIMTTIPRLKSMQTTTIKTKHDENNKTKIKLKHNETQSEHQKKCDCQEHISKLLSKIISCIQKMIPNFRSNDFDTYLTCKPYKQEAEVKNITINKTQVTKPNHTIDNVDKYSEVTSPNSGFKFSYKTFYSTRKKTNNSINKSLPHTYNKVLPITNNNFISTPKITHKNDDTMVNNIFNKVSMKPIFNYYIPDENNVNIERSTALDITVTKKCTTTPMSNEYPLEKHKTTTKNVVEDFRFDAHNIKFVNKDFMPNNYYKQRKKVNHVKGETEILGTTPFNIVSTTRKVYKRTTEMTKSTTIQIIDKGNINTVSQSYVQSGNRNSTKINLHKVSTARISYNILDIDIYKNNLSIINSQTLYDDITLEDETEQPNEIISSEESLKSLVHILKPVNDSKIEKLNKSNMKPTDSRKDFSSKPGIPPRRPSYLEIRRNDWKHEDFNDYDNTNNYYI